MFPDGTGLYLVKAALKSRAARLQPIALELAELLFMMKPPDGAGLCDDWVELAADALLLAQKAKDKERMWVHRAQTSSVGRASRG